MRFTGTLYDNLRQPGVFQSLERSLAGDRRAMRRAVLARLRLDDLLSNDSLPAARPDSEIVLSYADLLDGRLFTLLSPGDLEGMSVEVACPPSVLSDPSLAVPKVIRNWIQDDDGSGRPVFFMAAADGQARVDLANTMQARSGLDVTTLQQARLILTECGLSQEDATELFEHWYRWDRAIRSSSIQLRPFSGSPASAVPALRRFLREEAALGDAPDHGLSEFGVDVFRRALSTLEANTGRRDVVVAFLGTEHAKCSNESKSREIAQVRALIFHHMAEAIAGGNRAFVEHSASVGPEDGLGLRSTLLQRMERYDGPSSEIGLSPRIANALGDLSPSEYADVKARIAGRLAIGMQDARRSSQDIASEADLTGLHNAFHALTRLVGHGDTGQRAQPALRNIVWPAVGAVAGTAIQIHLADAQSLPRELVAAFWGAVTGEAAGQTLELARTSLSTLLLEKSFVRHVLRELQSPPTEVPP